jgi:hypothetical protein
MIEHYPRIRVRVESNSAPIREGLRIDFYMRHPHTEIARAVMRSLDVYLHAVGPQSLGWYTDEEGDWQDLDSAGWAITRRELLEYRWPIIQLGGELSGRNCYGFEYYGRPLDNPEWGDTSGMVCAASFWLPTEYLEEQGPEQVRKLALELAGPLPFGSGNAGLAFLAQPHVLGVMREIRARCFRYPGLDLPRVEHDSNHLGTRVRGPSWLTFLGQPVLGALGGVAGLRARLHSPGTTVEALEDDRAVVTLGEWPEAGDTELDHTLPAYRELARVLEPWLYQDEHCSHLDFTQEDMRRWGRRFLE